MPGQTPQQIFGSTPAGEYDVTYPLQMTIIDWILVLIEIWAAQTALQGDRGRLAQLLHSHNRNTAALLLR